MHELILFSGTVFMGFFAIMNPLANTPVFLGLTADDDSAMRRAVAFKGLALAFLIVAISPLAVPILAGPGTIATAMSFVAVRDFTHLAITIAVFALMCVISYMFFISGEKLVTYIGENAFSVVTRLMGLILAVIGVQMFIDGVYGAVRAYT